MKARVRLVTLLLFLLLGITPLLAAGLFVLEGRVSDPTGKAVSGAEIRLLNSDGKVRHRVLSDVSGRYRFPPVTDLPNVAPPRLRVTHIRFKEIEVKNALEGTAIATPAPAHLKPGESVALLAATKRLSRDFVLAPSLGTPQVPAVGPIDPNLAEYYYQRALLLLGENKKSEAVTYLTIYAQTGKNPRQINRALELIIANQ